MQREGSREKTVVVLGVGRSGTSAIAGIVNELGVDLGVDRPADESNPRGYFEDIEVATIISDLFASAGGTWRNPPSHEQFLKQRQYIDHKIQHYVAKRSKTRSIWGWKAPGSPLTIELFLPHLVNPHFIAVFRNPLKVSASLIKRTRKRGQGELGLDEALQLTHFNNTEILAFFIRNPDLPKIFVAFEDVLKDPTTEAKNMATFLGIEFTEEKERRVRKFVRTPNFDSTPKQAGPRVAAAMRRSLQHVIGRAVERYYQAIYYVYYRLYMSLTGKISRGEWR